MRLPLLAMLAFSVSAIAAPLPDTTTPSLHEIHAKGARVVVTLVNGASQFRDLEIAGHKYTVLPHETLFVKAPAGTIVYAASANGQFHRGDTVLELTPSMNDKRVTFN